MVRKAHYVNIVFFFEFALAHVHPSNFPRLEITEARVVKFNKYNAHHEGSHITKFKDSDQIRKEM